MSGAFKVSMIEKWKNQEFCLVHSSSVKDLDSLLHCVSGSWRKEHRNGGPVNKSKI